ncbi:hypothetical protein BRC74_04105 [Halobacteriales archaeon QH_7_68_42]|nr:MAG: hypothetical protein BRC74_04105 [Halobacteriales archaeon QH_7_68_42]
MSEDASDREEWLGDADGPTDTGGPRRLHILTVPYRIAQQGIGIVVFLFFVGVPGLTGALGPEGGLLGLVGIVAFASLFVGYFFAYYRRYEYELTADTFDIRSGVLSRREREIPLRRIQNVDISQSVTQRILGIASVSLETAGGGETEAQLQYVGEDEAERLQSEVSRLRQATEASPDDADAEAVEAPAETVFAISERELGVLALVSTDFRVVSLIFFAGSIFGPSAFDRFEPVFFGPESVLGVLFGPIAAIASIVVLGIFAGAVSAARYYGFTLTRSEEELRYERGLLQKYSGTIPLSKVQTISMRENVLARRLGYAALHIETAGHVASGGEGGGGSQSAVPLAERGRVRKLARSIEDAPLDEFERPPKRARERYAVRYSLVVFLLTGLLYLGSTATDLLGYWYLPLAGLVLVPVAAHLKWKHRGYHLAENHVVTRNGFWSRTTKVVPYHRVQTTVSTETVFQRRRDLGTVIVDVAGSRSITDDDPKAVDVDGRTADRVRETVPDHLSAALRSRKRDRSLDGLRPDPSELDDLGVDGPAEPSTD